MRTIIAEVQSISSGIDNAADPRAKGLPSFPHHKHLRSGGLVASAQMTLSEVLEEIEECK
jgi:hypothetical protein